MIPRSNLIRANFLCLLTGVILLAAGFCPNAHAQGEPAEEPAPIVIHPRPLEYGRDVFLPHLGQGTQASFFKRDALIALALGGVVTVAVSTQDEKIRDYWRAESPLGDWSEWGDQWGGGSIQPVIVLGMYGWGHYSKNQRLATNAEVLAEALIIQGVVVNVMKPAIGRERPDHSDQQAFPSGHTSNAFAFAAVMDDRYGHKWGVPLFAAATFVGLSRMEDNKHWASDVAFGATLGTVIGYAVSKSHDDYPYQKTWRRDKKITLLPILPDAQSDRTGVMIAWPVN